MPPLSQDLALKLLNSIGVKMINGYGDDLNKWAADLDIKIRRSEPIAANIADVDTPGYKANGLTFRRTPADNIGDENFTLKRTHVKYMTERETAAGIPVNEIAANPN
jgi:flagellar basal-body rod protein FlgB